MKKLNMLAIVGSLLILLPLVALQSTAAMDTQAIVDCDAKYFNSREKDPSKNNLDKRDKIRWHVFANTKGTEITFYFEKGSPFDKNVPSSFKVTVGDDPPRPKKEVLKDAAEKEYKYSIICTLPNGTEQWRLDPIIEIPRKP